MFEKSGRNRSAGRCAPVLRGLLFEGFAQFLADAVDLDLSNPNDIRLTFSTTGGQQVYTAAVPTGPGLGLPGGMLQVTTGGNADVQAGWNVNLTIGVDATGFYVDTGTLNELSLQINAGIPDALFAAKFAIANFSVSDEDADSNSGNNYVIGGPRPDIDGDGVNPSLANLNIGIDFRDPNSDGRLRDTEIMGVTNPFDLLRGTLDGFADVNLHFAGDMGSTMLPSFQFDFDFDWAFNAAIFGGAANMATFGSLPTLAFKNAQLDAGSIFDNFLKPLVFDLAKYLEPPRQVINALRTRLEALEGLPGAMGVLDTVNATTGEEVPDGKIHVLDIINKVAPGVVDPELVSFFADIDKVFHWAGVLSGNNFDPVYYNIGSFDLFGIDPRAANFDLETITPRVTAQLDNLENFTNDLLSMPALKNALLAWFPQAAGEPAATSSFEFPFFTDPLAFAKFVFGHDVDLFRANLAPMTFGFGSLANPIEIASIPVVPFVEAVLEGFANVTLDLDFGFDTSGIRNWVQFGGPMTQFLDGLWFSDHTEGGTDLPEIVFTAGINALARVNVGFASIAIGGGILGAVELDLKDPNFDGRVYLPELLITSNNGADPLGVFNAGGRITAGFTAYVSALNGFYEWRYNSPRTTLVDMTNTDNNTGNPQLGSMSGGTLTLNVGALANQRATSNKTDGAESVTITPISVADSISIGGFGGMQLFTGVTSIVANGGANSDDLDALSRPSLFGFAQSFPLIPMNLSGGAGNDHLGGGDVSDTLYGGLGSDFIEGRNGADFLYGDEGDDILDGGAGPDSMYGGDGNDVVAYQGSGGSVIINLANPLENAGDALGDVFFSIESIRGTPNGDIITGDNFNNTFFGDAGNDILNGGQGDDVLSGDAGGDTLNGGAGIDLVSYLQSATGVTVDLVNGSSGGDAQGDTYDSIERIVGSGYDDSLSGDDLGNYLAENNGNDTIVGRDGDDNLQGQNGGDTLYGDAGHDILAGGPGADTIFGGAGIDTVTYEDSPSAVGVNLDTDVNYSGDADGDVIASDVEGVIGSDYNDGITGDEQDNFLYGNDGNDMLNGLLGDDFLVGGPGADTMSGGGGSDTASYFSSLGAVVVNLTTDVNTGAEAQGDSLSGIENLDGSEFGDTLTGDSQRNTLTGRGGMDILDGAGGDDMLVGGDGPDILTGGAGVDAVSYALSPAGVTVNIITNTNTGGDAQGDVLSPDIEVFIGSSFDDSFTGNGLDNLFVSGLGADSYTGGGGNDTVTYETSPSAVSVNLTLGAQGGGYAAGDYIANDINTVLGSAWADSVTGDGDDNSFDGGDGADSLSGAGGADTLFGKDGSDFIQGGDGDDFLFGGADVDFIYGGADDDTVEGGAGADMMDGGGGTNKLSYFQATSGVTVSLALSSGSAGEAAGDSFSGFVNLDGSEHDDFLYGDGNSNVITGLGGNDYLDPGSGADLMLGGLGNDTYIVDSLGDLYFEYAGEGFRDLIVTPFDIALPANFEDATLTGTANTYAFGHASNNILIGNSGNNLLRPGRGVDSVDGGDGVDTIDYSDATSGVSVDLVAGYGTTGAEFDGDTIANVENVIGTLYSDNIDGDGSSNYIYIGLGRDYVDGRGGEDTLEFDWSGVTDAIGISVSSWNPGTGFLNTYTHYAGYADYHLAYMSNIEHVKMTGTPAADDLRGFGSSDVFNGMGGNDKIWPVTGADVIDGGAGNDSVIDGDYSGLTANFNFSNGALSEITTGTLIGLKMTSVERFQNLRTGSGNDSLIMSGDFDDTTNLGAGNDYIFIGLGYDFHEGGDGDDTAEVDWSGVTNPVGMGVSSWDPSTGFLNTYLYYEGYSDVHLFYLTNFEHVKITGSSAGDDIRGFGSSDVLNGMGGNDAIRPVTGADVIDGGAGNDSVIDGNYSGLTANFNFSNGALTEIASGPMSGLRMAGIERFQNLRTGSGDDSLIMSGDFDDTTDLGAGNDYIFIGLGYDQHEGGDGDDTAEVDWSGVTNPAGIAISSWNPATGFLNTYLYYEGNSDQHLFYVSNFEHVKITGSSAGDDIRGFGSSDVLNGMGGNDAIWPVTGADVIDGGTGNDSVIDGDYSALTANFIFNAATGSNEITTGTLIGLKMTSVERFQNLHTGSGNDSFILAGDYDDSIYLGAGADYVFAGLGRDAYYGEAGEDTLEADWSGVADANGISVNIYDPGSGTIQFFTHYAGNADYHQVYANSFEHVKITGTPVRDDIRGFGSNDVLNGMGGDDDIWPLTGADVIDGGMGVDSVIDGDYSALTANFIFNAATGSNEITTGTLIGLKMTSVERFQNLHTGSGSDSFILAGDYDDSIYLGAGADYVFAGLGRDAYYGEAGEDTLEADWSGVADANGISVNIYDPGSGTIQFFTHYAGNADYHQIQAYDFEHAKLTGTPVNDDLRGFNNADVLNGMGGNDTIRPYTGADVINGGLGNDIVLDANYSALTADFIFNAATGSQPITTGTLIGLQLTSVEQLYNFTTGSGNDSLTMAGDFDDYILFGAGNDYVFAGLGRDDFRAGTGTDTLEVDWSGVGDAAGITNGGHDPVSGYTYFYSYFAGGADYHQIQAYDFEHAKLTGTPANDDLRGFNGADVLNGSGGNDYLRGYDGNDSLDGGTGADTVEGGTGNDICIVDNPGDVVIESVGGGTDTVRALVSYTLPDNVEFLELLTPGITGTGNSGNNTLTSIPGGGALAGGAGDDTYHVQSIADIIAENTDEGNDTVSAIVSFTLGPNIENLILAGRAVSGTGNALPNIITGNSRNNDLHGGDGDDVLTGGTGLGLAGSREIDTLDGGTGADTFVLGDAEFRYYDDRSSLTPGHDSYARIVDFTPSAGDKLKLKGVAAEYFLAASPLAGVLGTGLFHDTDFDGLLDVAHDELIAIIESPDALTPTNTIHAALFI